jgi:hypothetical protein
MMTGMWFCADNHLGSNFARSLKVGKPLKGFASVRLKLEYC